jgi:hypothetical protein
MKKLIWVLAINRLLIFYHMTVSGLELQVGIWWATGVGGSGARSSNFMVPPITALLKGQIMLIRQMGG